MKHVFAVCAYKESPFLEECIKSLKNQSVASKIILCTSTPNEYIQEICNRYKIPFFVNEGESGITQDWNFAYAHADCDLVTIAHQDDIYDKHYVEYMTRMVGNSKRPIIFFTDYAELREGKKVYKNRLLNVKRLMLLPLNIKLFHSSKFVRRRILSLGSPICCPSVTYVKKNCPPRVFEDGFRSDEDWQAWEMLSKRKGSFVYCNKILTYHRIHEESATTKILADNERHKEDYIMFQKFWPKVIAKILTKVYGTSEKSNELN